MAQRSAQVQSLSSFVWSIAEILRGDFKQSEYGKVVLPFTVLRRLDCLLEDSKQAVLDAAEALPEDVDEPTRDLMLCDAAGSRFKVYNLSRLTFATMHGQDPGQLHQNLLDYVTKFSPNVRDIFLDKFLFTDQLKRLKEAGTLWQVFDRFCQIDLHPDRVTNNEMGCLFEELIRRFSEISNETAAEHFTPREVIRLIVDLLIANDDMKLTGKGIIRQIYDPACGTGGMLALTEEALKDFNPSIRVELFGQELNPESFAICKSDMLVNRDILDADMSDMLRNNPPDVVYAAFKEEFYKGVIRRFQRDNEMRSIILTDAEARERAIRHFFNRALREVRETGAGQ